MQRRLAAVLAADVVGYSRLMGVDEAGTLDALQRCRDEVFEPKAAQHSGRTVKLMGDGTLMEFASVVDAVTFAVDLQVAMRDRNADIPANRQIVFRIGINLGDIVHRDNDIFGDGVNVAARLEALAEPGGICISRSARDQVRDKLDLNLVDQGEIEVKNIARPVRAFQVGIDDKADALATPVVPVAADAPQPPGNRKSFFAAAVAACVLLAGGIAWWQPWALDAGTSGNSQTLRMLPNKPSIAVLPFGNLSRDAKEDYFADGISEDIITDLSKISELFVIARNTSFQFRNQSVDSAALGQQLGVRYILEGSVRRASGRVRINAQLVDTSTGGHVWAERYDGSLDDVFALQDDVTSKIINALKLKLTRAERQAVERRGTDNPAAYDAYLRGLRLLAERKRLDIKSNTAAQDEFKTAIGLDPDYALALSGLAWAKWLHSATISNYEAPDKIFGLAKASIALSDNALAYRVLSKQHFALEAWWYQTTRSTNLAVVELEKAKQLQPGDPDILAELAIALSFVGRPKEALELARKAKEINPNHPLWYFASSGIALLLSEQAEQAVQDLRAWAGLNTSWHVPHLFLAAAYGNTGESEAAAKELALFNKSWGYNSTLRAVGSRWAMGDDEQKIFERGLRAAGMTEAPG